MDFYKILLDIMKEKSLSIPDVARATGLSDSTVRSIISRKTKNVTLEVAFKISNGLNVSLERLNGDVFNIEDLNNKKSNSLTQSETTLLESYGKLNKTGKAEAIKRVEELTYISKYTETQKDYLIPFAAHDKDNADKNSNTYEEDNQHDLDIMLNDDEWK